ncbi:hypothetical protein MRX96_053707 [Rhipicephalus microplus]
MAKLHSTIKTFSPSTTHSDPTSNATRSWPCRRLRIPKEGMAALLKDDAGKQIKIRFDKGTTTLAFKYRGRSHRGGRLASHGGRIHRLADGEEDNRDQQIHAGNHGRRGAADCVYWQRVLARAVPHLRAPKPGTDLRGSCVKLLANILYNYKGMGLSLGVMICGWDKSGPGLYYVDNEGQPAFGQSLLVRFRIDVRVRNSRQRIQLRHVGRGRLRGAGPKSHFPCHLQGLRQWWHCARVSRQRNRLGVHQ